MEDVKEFLLNVDSASPAPGGGAVVAYTTSLAVALTRMAVNISMKRKSFQNYSEEERETVLSLMQSLKEKEEKIFLYKEKDVETFNEFMVAYKSKNEVEIEKMTKKCFELPYELYKLIEQAIEIIFSLKKYVVASVYSDYKISLIMLESMIYGCKENMLINLKNINDETIKANYDEVEKNSNALILRIKEEIKER